MAKVFKIKRYWVLTLGMLLFSLVSFGQTYSDETIGFDVVRVTASLKEHGVKDENLTHEITMMREMRQRQYMEMKKIEETILQKIEAEQNAKIQKNRATNNAKTTVNTTIPWTEREALKAFYNSTDGTNWNNVILNNKPWKINDDTSDVSTWYGVSVSDGHVIKLELIGNNLKGNIPAQIGDLKNLQMLDLSKNDFTGGIPAEIGELANLQTLILNNSRPSTVIRISIPVEIGKLTNLQTLNLSGLGLVGGIPVEIGKLTKLRTLDLSGNELGGIVPVEIGNLTNLQMLNLSGDYLTGSIPVEIGKLTNLQTLNLAFSGLSGSIPAEIGKLTNLQILNLSLNGFEGGIPIEIGKLTKLRTLDLSWGGGAGGIIPEEIGNLMNLQILLINDSQLIGSIPTQIGKLENLQTLDLAWNGLSGSIPVEIGNLKSIKEIILYSNELTGSIPVQIGNLKNLQTLHLYGNKLTGNIPAEIVNSTNLKNLFLNQNQLEGSIPDLRALPLKYFHIEQNKFRFIDFATEFIAYTVKMPYDPWTLEYFSYAYQAKINIPETINISPGKSVDLKMFADGDTRYLADDTYQWFKNGTPITGATNRVFNIPNITAANEGTYVCMSYHLANPDMSPLVLEREPIILSVTNASNCDPTIGNISTALEQFCIKKESAFSFQTTATGLSYKWSVTTPSGELIHTVSNTSGAFAYTFSIVGSYVIKAVVTNDLGCKTTFTKPISVIECDAFCVNKTIKLSFETTATGNINYNWYAVKEGSEVHLDSISNTTGLYNFKPTEIGTYKIHLTAYERSECKYEFEREVRVYDCPFVSCTKDNPNTFKIKTLFTKLANKLASLPAATVTNGYTCNELKVLAHYIKDKNPDDVDEGPGIYNFVHDTIQRYIAFSFANHPDYDVKIATNGNQIVDFKLDNFESDSEETELITPTSTVPSYINHINFCSEPYCVQHIAFVVDESGSIDTTEAGKIKKQLKKYIKQQADDNDRLQSNIYVSLIGMSDSDTNGRIDHVLEKRVSNENPAELRLFYNWIDNYRKPNKKQSGVSPYSDYWKSGLDVALASSIKPNVVMMITDGCETTDVVKLRDETMSHFNNSKSTLDTSANKPHLYVVGIGNGFYVDQNTNGTSSANNQSIDPNDPSRVAPILRTSLKYLLSYPETGFPSDKLDDFTYDFHGYENFDNLGVVENQSDAAVFFSDYLKMAKFVCGKPTDKDYCTDCLSFQPVPGKDYMLSAWVKEESKIQLKNYENPVINIAFYNNVDTNDVRYRIGSVAFTAKGDIIDGWQRITDQFKIPPTTQTIIVELENKSGGVPVYFDDIRIHPLDGSVKTFVYDSETFKLMSELDENNYSTFYEYDNEGGLVRIKKETAKGVKTIQETRSGNVIKEN